MKHWTVRNMLPKLNFTGHGETFRLPGKIFTALPKILRSLLQQLEKGPSKGLKSHCRGLNKALRRAFSGPAAPYQIMSLDALTFIGQLTSLLESFLSS